MFRILLAVLVALAFSVSLVSCGGGDEVDTAKMEKRPPVPADERRPPPGPGSAAESDQTTDAPPDGGE